MFNVANNNLLKQLKDVQYKIRQYRAVIEKCKIPTTNFRMSRYMSERLGMLMNGDIDIDTFVQYDKVDFNYLEELGTYLVNIAKYQTDTEKYQEELRELKNLERNIKNALGID